MFSGNSNNRQQLSDCDLIDRYRFSHDNVYIGELFQRYSHMLFGVCLKYVKDEDKAKDVVMDVFEKVLLDLKRHPVENFKHLNGESDEETDRRLDAAIDELKDGQRECIRMYYFEKKSYDEIEAKTGYTYKQVKSFLQNGKRNLKIKLSATHE